MDRSEFENQLQQLMTETKTAILAAVTPRIEQLSAKVAANETRLEALKRKQLTADFAKCATDRKAAERFSAALQKARAADPTLTVSRFAASLGAE